MLRFTLLSCLVACDSVTYLTLVVDVPEGLDPGSVVVEVTEGQDEWPGFTGLQRVGEVCDGAAVTLTYDLSDTGPCHTDLAFSAWFVAGAGCGAEEVAEVPTETPWATATALEGAECGRNEGEVTLSLSQPG